MDIYKEIYLMQQTYATFFTLANKLQVEGDKYFGELTARQLMTMIAIAHLAEDETTINNIAKKLGTTKQSVKQLITILEKKEFIITIPSLKDKRAVNVKITEEGKRAMLDGSEKGLYFMEDFFKEFTTEDLETLWALLKRLYRFDGREQDGFEEDTNIEISQDMVAQQERAMKEFTQRRMNSLQKLKGTIGD